MAPAPLGSGSSWRSTRAHGADRSPRARRGPSEALPPAAPPRRPVGLWLLTVVLLASPVVHGAALAAGRHWLNFGSRRPWDGFVYFAIAPFVGFLMLRRHERARFSVYVFLSCEILRAVRIDSLALGALAVGALVYLQLPAARRFHPSVDPRRVLARIGVRREGWDTEPEDATAAPDEVAETRERRLLDRLLVPHAEGGGRYFWARWLFLRSLELLFSRPSSPSPFRSAAWSARTASCRRPTTSRRCGRRWGRALPPGSAALWLGAATGPRHPGRVGLAAALLLTAGARRGRSPRLRAASSRRSECCRTSPPTSRTACCSRPASSRSFSPRRGVRPGFGAHDRRRARPLLLRWEWFRIYFESGLVKLASGDPQWRDLSAMDHYYENGPLPTWLGWWAHQMPHGWHAFCALFTLVAELLIVWMAWLPRRFRIATFCVVTPLQIGIILTANYAFLNYLVLVLGVLLVDDRLLARLGWRVPPPTPGRARRAGGARSPPRPRFRARRAPRRLPAGAARAAPPATGSRRCASPTPTACSP